MPKKPYLSASLKHIAMKQHTFTILLALAVLWTSNASAQKQAPFFKNTPANVVNWRAGSHSVLPEYVAFNPSQALPLSAVPKWLRHQFQLSNDFGLQLSQQQTDNLGMEHYRYQQTYKGLPIAGAMYMVHTKNKQVTAMNGVLTPQIDAANTPQLTESAALDKALQHIGACLLYTSRCV